MRTAADFDAVIVGGALYARRWHRAARWFVTRHLAELRRVPTWFFSSGPLDDSADLIDSRPVITIRPDDSLALAAQTMRWAGVRHLPVVRDTEVVGVLSERDIFRRNGEVGARAAARDPVSRANERPGSHHRYG